VRLGRSTVAAIGIGLAALALAFVVVTTVGAPPRQTETGIVVFVDSVSLTDVRGFAIRTEDGRTIEFRVGQLENASEFPPSHLGEHQATSIPIRVTFRDEAGERVALRLEDAAPAASPS
jgi:hypothetical protein